MENRGGIPSRLSILDRQPSIRETILELDLRNQGRHD